LWNSNTDSCSEGNKEGEGWRKEEKNQDMVNKEQTSEARVTAVAHSVSSRWVALFPVPEADSAAWWPTSVVFSSLVCSGKETPGQSLHKQTLCWGMDLYTSGTCLPQPAHVVLPHCLHSTA
jgi:hypothetical protein